MYENIAKVHGISRPNGVISLKRTEWQQPNDVFPPLHKRLTGQKRRRILGAFPETENDVSDRLLIFSSSQSHCRKLVGELYLNKHSINTNVFKQQRAIHYLIDINFPNGLLKVFINQLLLLFDLE